MTLDDDDSPWLSALRADLPSAGDEARLRKRLVAAGVAVGNGLAASSVAAATSAATPAGIAASTTAPVATISWVAKAGVALLLAAPVVALPLLRESRAPSSPASVPSPSARARSIDHGPRLATGKSRSQLEPREVASTAAPTGVEAATDRPHGATARTPATARPRQVRAPAPGIAVATVVPVEKDAPPNADAGTEHAATTHEAQARAFAAPSTLGEETRLLDAAFVALAAGETLRARSLLDEHEALFPNGLLTRERRRARTKLANASGEGPRE